MDEDTRITIDFDGEDDVAAQLNAFSNDRLLEVQQAVDDLVNGRRDAGELED